MQAEGRTKSRERRLKKGGSYIERRIDFIKKRGSDIEIQIAELAGKTGHETLGVWACDCAERVLLPYFEKECPDDVRPRRAIEAGRAWARTGVFRMAEVRKASLDAHAAARDARDAGQDAACFAARAAGHALATAHVAAHAFGAAGYAIKAIVASGPPKAENNAEKERSWQYQRLLDLRR